jgi:hypothetical protein
VFASFLLPWIDRGGGPLFHWVMLAQMARFAPEEIAFLGDAAYFDPAHVPFGKALDFGGMRVDCPSREAFARHRTIVLPDKAYEPLRKASASELDAFRHLLTAPYPPLVDLLEKALRELSRGKQPLEAAFTWCNCPSLDEAAGRLGVPVVHNELGPLRAPHFRSTIYFDFRGVNGRTSAMEDGRRYAASRRMAADSREIAHLLVRPTRDIGALALQPDFELGVPLQVEDDSNVIAFSNGFTNISLVAAARRDAPASGILIRRHPGGHFEPRPGLGAIDDSPTSLEFLFRCKGIVSINSSVAVEALLLGRPARLLGDSPARHLADAGAGAARAALPEHIFLG